MNDKDTKHQWVKALKRAVDIIEDGGDMTEVSQTLVSIVGDSMCDLSCLASNIHFFQTILDMIPTPVYYKDIYGIYIGCNEAMARLHNMKKSDIIGRTAQDIYTEEEARTFSYSDTVLMNEQSHEMVEHKGHFTTMGGAFHILYKKLIVNPDGSPAGVLGFINDVSEIKQNEERAWQSEAFYKSLFDNSPRPRIIFNEFSILEDMNISAIKFFGDNSAALIGGSVMDIFEHYEDYESVINAKDQTVKVSIKRTKDEKPIKALASLTVSHLHDTEKYAVSFILLESIL